MNRNLLIVLAVLPSIVLGIYIYIKDKMGKEPIKLLLKLLFGGVCAIALTLIISEIVGRIIPVFNTGHFKNEFELFLHVFFGIALVEEFSKWYNLKKISWENPEFNHVYDAIVYAVFVTLGFATIENILYVIRYDSLSTAIMRSVVSVPGHVFDAVLMGAFYGEAKQAQLKKNNAAMKFNLAFSLIVPTFAHGFFDYLLFLDTNNATIIFFSLVAFLYVVSFIVVNQISKVKHNFVALTCPRCGSVKEDSRFCTKCGMIF